MTTICLQLDKEFERLRARSPWMASFAINGRVFGSGLNHDHDVRPPHFFRLVGNPARILELGSCQGGGTFQLAKHPAVREVVAIEGRDYNVEKAQFVAKAQGIRSVVFLEGDLESFDITSLGEFDAVYCVGILYHLPNPWELLAKLAAVTNLLYINTHYCPVNEVGTNLRGHAGKKWLEFGYEDPLSGLSSWSFWPTLQALSMMLLEAGFIPEILETDTLGLGQSPHGATILARRAETISEPDKQDLIGRMRDVLAKLPASSGSLQPVQVSWLRKTLATLKRLTARPTKKSV